MQQAAALTTPQLEQFRSTTILRAERLLADYPQYRGHWNGWGLVEVQRDIRTKLGVAFRRGELVLARIEPGTDTPAFVTAFSMSNRVDTSVPAKHILWVLAPEGGR